MCGIVGIVGPRADRTAVERALAVIEHRGPDASGIEVFDSENWSAILGHRRLSIIDLSSRSNQPFTKDRLTITFNGEIYNFQDVRKQLESRGHQFSTQSDTEVILEAWRAWGSASIDYLRGMFAFAIFDQQDNSVTLVRDNFGIKPLFYTTVKDTLFFGSELKAVISMLEARPAVDRRAMCASMLYGWVPENLCMFEGIKKLQPGCWACFKPNQTLQIGRYWNAAAVASEASSRPINYDEFSEIIRESVDAHLISDVPISSLLSGGLDSSLISVMAKQRLDQINCFTIGFKDDDSRFEQMPDDLTYARLITDKHNLELNEIIIDPDITSLLPETVYQLDEPIGDPAAINVRLICSAARENGSKVLLSGIGADEMFAGYRRHLACHLARYYRMIPKTMRSSAIEKFINFLPAANNSRGFLMSRWAKRFISFAGLPEEAAFRRSYTYYDEVGLNDILAYNSANDVESLILHHTETYNKASNLDNINRMCLTDVQMFLPSLNLAYTDRASMWSSTEIRVPFVDKNVFEAAFRLQGYQKLRGQQSKLALKKVAENWLPHDIIYRPKGLFSAPIRSWVRRDMNEFVRDTLEGGSLISCGYLNQNSVSQIIQENYLGKRDLSKEIWQLITSELWLRQFT